MLTMWKHVGCLPWPFSLSALTAPLFRSVSRIHEHWDLSRTAPFLIRAGGKVSPKGLFRTGADKDPEGDFTCLSIDHRQPRETRPNIDMQAVSQGYVIQMLLLRRRWIFLKLLLIMWSVCLIPFSAALRSGIKSQSPLKARVFPESPFLPNAPFLLALWFEYVGIGLGRCVKPLIRSSI